MDVDGVLVPYPGPRRPDGYVERRVLPGQAPVPVRAVHGPWLHELAAVYDLRWGTGWNVDDRRRLSAVLDLPPMGTGIVMRGPFHPRDKVPAIAAVAGDRPVAWVDDHLTPEAWAWAEGRRLPALLVPVDSERGLERKHVDRLLAWAPAAGA